MRFNTIILFLFACMLAMVAKAAGPTPVRRLRQVDTKKLRRAGVGAKLAGTPTQPFVKRQSPAPPPRKQFAGYSWK